MKYVILTLRFLANFLAGLSLLVLLIGTSFWLIAPATGDLYHWKLELDFQIPWKQLAQERDSMWAAAVRAYRAEQPYEFNSGEIAQISEYIQEFGDPDPWMDKICSVCNPSSRSYCC